MTRIRVNPNTLNQSAGSVTQVSGGVRKLGDDVWRSASSAPSYQGQFGPKVRAIGQSALSQAQKHTTRMNQLSGSLGNRASAFLAADIFSVNHRKWLPPQQYFTDPYWKFNPDFKNMIKRYTDLGSLKTPGSNFPTGSNLPKDGQLRTMRDLGKKCVETSGKNKHAAEIYRMRVGDHYEYMVLITGSTDWLDSTSLISAFLAGVGAFGAISIDNEVKALIEAAHIEKGATIHMAGYSQGGIIAERLVEENGGLSAHYNMASVTTFGSPQNNSPDNENTKYNRFAAIGDRVPYLGVPGILGAAGKSIWEISSPVPQNQTAIDGIQADNWIDIHKESYTDNPQLDNYDSPIVDERGNPVNADWGEPIATLDIHSAWEHGNINVPGEVGDFGSSGDASVLA